MTRYHAHRPDPNPDMPVWAEVVGFLLGLAMVLMLLVLVLGTGPVT